MTDITQNMGASTRRHCIWDGWPIQVSFSSRTKCNTPNPSFSTSCIRSAWFPIHLTWSMSILDTESLLTYIATYTRSPSATAWCACLLPWKRKHWTMLFGTRIKSGVNTFVLPVMARYHSALSAIIEVFKGGRNVGMSSSTPFLLYLRVWPA